MLHITNVADKISELIEIKSFPIVTIYFGIWKYPPFFSWLGRTGNYTSLQIDLDKNGQIVRIMLFSMIEKDNAFINKSTNVRYGIPVFDTSFWNVSESSIHANYYQASDENINCKVFLGKNFYSLFLFETTTELDYIQNNRVCFGINKNGVLCRIDVTELSKKEYCLLRQSINTPYSAPLFRGVLRESI